MSSQMMFTWHPARIGRARNESRRKKMDSNTNEVCETCKHYKHLLYVNCKGEGKKKETDQYVWWNDQRCENYESREIDVLYRFPRG